MPSESAEQLFPKRGEVWREPSRQDTVRVMATVDGYVMVRYKTAMPFLVPIRDWRVRYIKVQT